MVALGRSDQVWRPNLMASKRRAFPKPAPCSAIVAPSLSGWQDAPRAGLPPVTTVVKMSFGNLWYGRFQQRARA
jgi:hypothetical protein